MQTTNSNTAKQAGNIQYCFTPDGGFVAADLDSGYTSYAYPTSPFATDAKTHPARIAAQMMADEKKWRRSGHTEYDARNLARIVTAKTK